MSNLLVNHFLRAAIWNFRRCSHAAHIDLYPSRFLMTSTVPLFLVPATRLRCPEWGGTRWRAQSVMTSETYGANIILCWALASPIGTTPGAA